MKNKLKFLTKISLSKKIKSKWFIITNILLAILIVGLVNIDSIIKLFGGDFNETTDILVIDNTNSLYDDLYNSYINYKDYIEDISATKMIEYDKDIESAKKEIMDKESLLLVIDNDDNNFIKASLISKDKTSVILTQLISSSLNEIKSNIALSHYNISSDLLKEVNVPVEIEKIKLDDSKNSDDMMDLFMGVIFPIMILPFFMLTIYLVQMIGAEINEEKTTKGMEIIISNVPAKIHFLSKLISSNVFVIFQGLILIFDGLIGLFIRTMTSNSSIENLLSSVNLGGVMGELTSSGVLDNLVYIIPITIILMLLTFIAYSLLAGVLASMTTNQEDFQQLQSPIVVISLLGYYLAMMASMFDGSIFIRIFSYIPFISSLLMPALLMLGQIGIIDVIISFVLLVITILLLVKYGMRIYKVGILNYSSTGLWKKMFKALKS